MNTSFSRQTTHAYISSLNKKNFPVNFLSPSRFPPFPSYLSSLSSSLLWLPIRRYLFSPSFSVSTHRSLQHPAHHLLKAVVYWTPHAQTIKLALRMPRHKLLSSSSHHTLGPEETPIEANLSDTRQPEKSGVTRVSSQIKLHPGPECRGVVQAFPSVRRSLSK